MNMLATVCRNQGRWLDKFFSGYWFWRFRLWVVDRHVGSVLDRYGEQSIEARRALARCSRVHFAVQFGGMAPSWERTAVRKAKNAGLSTDDIRVVVRNRNFVEAGEWLAVRQTWWLSVAVAWVFPVVAGFRWVLLCVYTLTMPGEAWMKAITIATFTIVYWVIWRGVSLYTTRPLAAGARLAQALKMRPIATEASQVIPMRQHVLD